MLLTHEEKRMCNGEYGPGIQKAMTILARYGDILGADKMAVADIVDISGCLPVDFVEELAEGVDEARAPVCFTHAVLDPAKAKEYGLCIEEGVDSIRGLATTDAKTFVHQMDMYKRLGFLPTFTCAPYLVGIVPTKGNVVITVSHALNLVASSLFGAKSARVPVFNTLASAITGRYPCIGSLKDENRYAKVLVELDNLDLGNFTEADYGALGYYIGSIAANRNVAIKGLLHCSFDQCRALMTGIFPPGITDVCHIIGLTPEAPTVEAALGNKKPEETVSVGNKEINEAKAKLITAERNEVDIVSLGCPHCTITQLREIASLLEGKRVHANVRLEIVTAKPIYSLAQRAGYADIIEEAGSIIAEYCVGGWNPAVALSQGERVVATNSVGVSYWVTLPDPYRVKVFYGDTKSCINSAITGKWEGR